MPRVYIAMGLVTEIDALGGQSRGVVQSQQS